MTCEDLLLLQNRSVLNYFCGVLQEGFHCILLFGTRQSVPNTELGVYISGVSFKRGSTDSHGIIHGVYTEFHHPHTSGFPGTPSPTELWATTTSS